MALLAAGAYAYVALGSGIDRAGPIRPDLIPYIPEGLRARALVTSGGSALKQGDLKRALVYGMQAVDKAPMEDSSTALLGTSRLLTGDGAGADAAFRVAATRGWRVPMVQLYWLRRALEVQDYRAAATRLDAMLRQQTYLVRNRDIMDPFEADPDAMPALVTRLQTRPFWLTSYVGDVVNMPLDQLQNRAEVMLQLAAKGTRLECAMVAGFAGELVRHSLVPLANRVWAAHCGGKTDHLVRDGGLASLNAEDAGFSPFAWQVFATGDLRVEPGEGRFAGLLKISTTSAFMQPVVRQMIVAPSGRYRLTWIDQSEIRTSVPSMVPLIGCDYGNLQRVAGQQNMGGGRWQADVTFDGQCDGRWLQFSVKAGTEPIAFGKVALVPMAPGLH